MVTTLKGTCGLGALMLCALAAPAAAQNTNPLNAFDFSLPGARSRGIGGAFVAIADDATTVYSNPAGLSLLFRPEFSIEGRRWGFTSSLPDTGHAFGPPTGIGIDTVAGVRNRSWHSSATGPSFLSFVYPGDRWAVGIFGHQLARYNMTRDPVGALFDCAGGFRGDAPPQAPFCEPHAKTDGIDRDFPKIQTVELDIRSIGSGFAFDWTDWLSVGLSVQHVSFDMDSHNQVFAAREGQKYLPADFDYPSNGEIESRQGGRDHAWSLNAGVLVDLSEKWTVGASFRQGPAFGFQVKTTTGPVNLTGAGRVVADERQEFRVPDTYAVGIGFRPSAPWRLSVEYDRVLFGQLNRDFREVAQFDEDPEGRLIAQQVRLDDANQVRVGGEYALVFRSGTVLAFRSGAWYDPFHEVYFDADPATGLPGPRWALQMPRQKGTMHWSGGFGLVLWQRLQIDAAVDLSSTVDVVSLSSVWRF